MTSTMQVATQFSAGLVIGLPAIPGIKSMAWFGTGNDANEGNRVVGGPALLANGPIVHAANYVTVGNVGLAGTNGWFDTQVARDAAMIASGWTWAVCTRLNGAAVGIAEIIGDTGHQMALQNAPKQVQLYSGGLQASIVCATPLTNWHLYAGTYSGGARGTFTLYELTDKLTPASWTRTTDVLPAASNVRIGATTAGTFDDDPVDTAWAMVAAGPMSGPALTTLAASVSSFLALRGIVA